MGKNLTRIIMLCGLLAVLLSATAWAVVSSATLAADTDEAAELAATIVGSGNCGATGEGTNLTWTLNSDAEKKHLES